MVVLTSIFDPLESFFLYSTANGLFLVQAVDRKLSSGDFSANVKGNSGKVEFVRRGSDGRFNFAKAFTLEVDYVIQKDKDNGDVGKAVNNLASQVFSFSDLDEDAVYQNISAVNLNLDSYLTAADATLKLEIYIFKEAGNVTFGDEIFQVQNGTLKLLIKVCCERTAVGLIIGMNVPSVNELKGPLSTTPLILFNYMLEFGYYSELAETKEITVRLLKIIKDTFRNAIYSKAIRFCYRCYRWDLASALTGQEPMLYQSIKHRKRADVLLFFAHYLYIIKQMKKPKPCIIL